MGNDVTTHVTLVDSHVHYHTCFALSTFLDSASQRLGESPAEVVVLLLAQMDPKGDPLAEIRTATPRGEWLLTDVPQDPHAILCYQEQVPRLVLVAGRQLVTREGLEVLALCTAAPLRAGRVLAATLDEIAAHNGVAVLPWGFGKWWFRRGQVLRELLHERGPRRFLLGDNGGRPAAFGRPPQLRLGLRNGIPVLAGSDPLPWKGQETRVGSYANVLEGSISVEQPTQWMREKLLSLTQSPVVHGKCRSMISFVRDQLQLRIAQR